MGTNNEMRQKESAAQSQAQADMQAKQLEQQLQISREDREDKQQAALDQIAATGAEKLKQIAAQGKSQMFVDKNKSDFDAVVPDLEN